MCEWLSGVKRLSRQEHHRLCWILNKGFDHWVTKLNASRMVKALLRLENRRKRQALCN